MSLGGRKVVGRNGRKEGREKEGRKASKQAERREKSRNTARERESEGQLGANEGKENIPWSVLWYVKASVAIRRIMVGAHEIHIDDVF